MTTFSANLGFLWRELSLPDAIHAAHRAGFDAVECHWPFDTPADAVRAALQETGLSMLGLNTRRGDTAAGENGLAAVSERKVEARAAIDEAIAYADAIDAGAIHVMAGVANGADARACFLDNLAYAAAQTKRTILIEPLNRHDAPGYYLSTTDQAAAIVDDVRASNVKIMFDCYHVGRSEGDVITRLKALIDKVGHIQFASVPDRGTPDHGEIDYPWLFDQIDRLGWKSPLGAEYKPDGPTAPTLGWMR